MKRTMPDFKTTIQTSIDASDVKKPYIVLITSKYKDIKWDSIERKIGKTFPTQKIIYTRFNDGEGHILFSTSSFNEAEYHKLDGQKVVISKH